MHIFEYPVHVAGDARVESTSATACAEIDDSLKFVALVAEIQAEEGSSRVAITSCSMR